MSRYERIKKIVESKLVDRVDKDYVELSEEAFGKAYSLCIKNGENMIIILVNYFMLLI